MNKYINGTLRLVYITLTLLGWIIIDIVQLLAYWASSSMIMTW